MRIEGISAFQVSNMTKELNYQVEKFRNRALNKEYSFIWVEALYEKIRDNGKVINVAVLVVRAVDLDEIMQIIAVGSIYNESEATYTIIV